MSIEDPNKYYPYQTKGVIYETPPSAANFPDDGQVRNYSNAEQSDDDYDAMDVDEETDEEDSKPLSNRRRKLGDGLSGIFQTKQQDGSGAGLGTIAEENNALDVGTYGVELEFLVVQCPRVTMEGERLVTREVHPNETRWISRNIARWQLESLQRKQVQMGDLEMYGSENGAYWDSEDDEVIEFNRSRYSRSKLTRVLRNRGMTVIKWPELEIHPYDREFVHINDFSESDATDDELEDNFPNSIYLDDFTSTYTYDPFQNNNENVEACLLKWQSDFEEYHHAHDLKFNRTLVTEIVSASNRCYVNEWDISQQYMQWLRETLQDRLQNVRIVAKQARENARNSQEDPLHVPVDGLNPQYKAWTVTVDLSVDGNGMSGARYANANTDPFNQYYWFGAEVVSPVLAIRDERAQQAIRDACGSLRDALRCHKPMQVSTGLHIHLGHTKGWTLFQAKRFASLWFLIEKTILSLHRIDRDLDKKWCAKIGEGSRLWRALYGDEMEQRHCARAALHTYAPAIKRVYMNEYGNNIPILNRNLTESQQAVLYHIWQYNSIDNLHNGLGESTYCRTGIKWRIRGKSSSLQGYEDPDIVPEPGTIEVRIMHGTLDADHINNWVAVLERVTHVVRDLSDDDFSSVLDRFLSNQTRERLLELLGLPQDIQQYWLDRRRRDAANEYWEYPDRDLVDWRQPFMVRGHKATHGAAWD